MLQDLSEFFTRDEIAPGFGVLLGSAVGQNAIWPRLADSRMVEWDHRSDRTVDHVIGAF